MAINTTTVESNLTTKLNNTSGTTDAKEFLLLGKAVEALQPSVTLSSVQSEGTTQVGLVNTAGTTQVANVNTAGTTQIAAVQAAGASYAPLAGATFTGDINMGANDIISTGKMLYSNVYNTTGDLPSASTYHGMFAHVHGTGKGYFAHGGNWIPLVNEDTSGNVSLGGDLTVTGGLTVNGTTTTINSTTLDVDDLNITVAKGAADAAAANGAGLSVDGASATFTYANTGDKWAMNKPLDVTGAVTATGAIVNGPLDIEEVQERFYANTSTSGTFNFNLASQAIAYITANQTANRTINFRGNSTETLDSILDTGKSMTCAIMMTQGSTAYYLNAFQIDGTSVTPKWVGGAPTGGTANAIDTYTFTILKTSSANFTVLANLTAYE